MIEELAEFIKSNPDARELKRAITVKMWLKGYRGCSKIRREGKKRVKQADGA